MHWRKPAPPRPGFLEPCLPTPSKVVPRGALWVHEIKHDGYRMMIRKNDAGVRLVTRRGYDWTKRFPRIVEAAMRLKVRSLMIDGEAIVCGKDGISDFNALHSQRADEAVVLFGFDLIELNGEDLRLLPLEARKARLGKLLARVPDGIYFN